ncbi:MAG TPA: class I SAM-dependent methyltransferase [bacterium]|nr:class I SAM-dependent methyltransferase [bacterium]
MATEGARPAGNPLGRLARRATTQRWLQAPVDFADAVRRVEELHTKQTVAEIVDTALDLGSRGLYKVKASQYRGEILTLAERVAALKPKVIVEIGVYKGGTALIWSQLASELVVLCDLRTFPFRKALFKRFPRPGGAKLEILSGNSHDPAFKERLVRLLNGRPIDFLLIDGDHTVAGVQQDFDDYAPLVRPGGLIACHDIVPQQRYPWSQVHVFWQQLKDQGGYQLEELVEDWDQVGCGIGVLRVPDTPAR